MLTKDQVGKVKHINALSNIKQIKSKRVSLKTRVVLITVNSFVLIGILFSVNESRFLDAQVAYAIPTVIALLAIGFVAWRQGLFGLLNPVVSVMVGFLFFFSAAPLINPSNSNWAIEIYSEPSRFLPLAGLYLLGLIAFLMGTLLPLQARVSPRGQGWLDFEVDINKLWRWYLVILLIAVVCLATLIILNDLNPIQFFLSSRYFGGQIRFSHPLSRYLDQLFGYLIIALGVFSGMVLALSYKSKRRVRALLTVSLCGLYLLATGIRSHFLYLVGGSILVWWGLRWRDTRQKIKLTPGLIWGGLFIIFLASQMILIRNTQGGLVSYLSRGPRLVSLRSFVDYGIDQNISLEQVLNAVPDQRPYVGGISFISPFVAFVPRQLWAGKPTTAWAYMQGYSIFNKSPNASFSLLGELYMNFGFVGVTIGMIVVGFFTQRWHQLYVKHKHSVLIPTLYYMSLPAFAFLVRGDFQAAMTPIFYPGLVVLFVLRASRRKVSKPNQ